jgi:hypothetical protein
MEPGYHLAGIVPVAGQKLDFNMPWHDCLMPIAKNYLAIERAVVDCGYAGCETIFIVCHNDMMPLIKARLGDYIEDPVYAYRNFETFSHEVRVRIPIYYIAVHPHDRDKRDSLAWSVLYGAKIANEMIGRLSSWLVPNKFFASFPYGIHNPELLREHRRTISSPQNFSLSWQGKTVIEDEYLPFTFDYEQCLYFIDSVRGKGTSRFINQEWGDKKVQLPREEQYSARFFSLSDVFCDLEFEIIEETPYYFNISSWDGYQNFISNKPEGLRRPTKRILNPRSLKGIGIENE